MLRVQRWLVVVGVLLILGLFALAGLLRPLGDALRFVTLPVVRGLDDARISIASIWSKKPSTEEAAHIADLESRVRALAVDQVHLQALEEENKTLRAQARFLTTSGYDSVGARVISREIRDQRALLLIDRGQRDGVEIGQAVVTDAGILVGKISILKDRVATVELLTDPRSRVATAVQGTLVGVAEGRGNGVVALNYVPASESLKRDQLVTTAGTEEKIPRNLPIGVINVVQGKSTDPFVTASLEPLIAFDRVVFVSVLRPSALSPSL